MKLIIDIGNTNTKLAIFDDKKIVKTIILANLELTLIKNFLGKIIISSTIISCVKAVDNNIVNIVNHFNAYLFDESTKIPIDNKYKI